MAINLRFCTRETHTNTMNLENLLNALNLFLYLKSIMKKPLLKGSKEF